MEGAHYSVGKALKLRLYYSILTDWPVFRYTYMGILFHTKIEWALVGIILITRAHGYIFV